MGPHGGMGFQTWISPTRSTEVSGEEQTAAADDTKKADADKKEAPKKDATPEKK